MSSQGFSIHWMLVLTVGILLAAGPSVSLAQAQYSYVGTPSLVQGAPIVCKTVSRAGKTVGVPQVARRNKKKIILKPLSRRLHLRANHISTYAALCNSILKEAVRYSTLAECTRFDLNHNLAIELGDINQMLLLQRKVTSRDFRRGIAAVGNRCFDNSSGTEETPGPPAEAPAPTPTNAPTQAMCSDGQISEGELCDDGNTNDGDGCDSTCQVESGDWSCTGEPSICTHGGWIPPLGIPAPEFGITQTHRMYEGQQFDFGNGPITYPDAGNGPYTHYLDNTDPNATDTSNPFGTPARPRLTLPTVLPAGSVVEVHGGDHDHPYYGSFGNTSVSVTMNGSSEKPIFVRGYSSTFRPIIHRLAGRFEIRTTAQYVVFENLSWRYASPYLSDTDHHIAVRYSEIAYKPTQTHGCGIGPRKADYIVYFGNHIHHNGDSLATVEDDIHGIQVGMGAHHIWILENHIHENGGDSVQINSGAGATLEDSARYIYIGRNNMHDEGENAVDIKYGRDLIVSENNMYNFRDSPGSDGTAVVLNDERLPGDSHIWIIGNTISHAFGGIRIQQPGYVVGNLIHDIQHNPAASYNPDSVWQSGQAIIAWAIESSYIVNNTIYRVDAGIGYPGGGALNGITIANNIISALQQPSFHIAIPVSSVADNSTLQNNLFDGDAGAARIRWKSASQSYSLSDLQTHFPGVCADCKEAPAQFMDASNDDMRLQAMSPARDSGITSDVYSSFRSLYGIHLNKDFEGNARPRSGTPYDIGAYEN